MNRVENERRTEAATILRQLALGIDPQSGRLLDAGHVALRPVNMEALLLAIESLASKAEIPEIAERRTSQGSSSWGKQEDVELRELLKDEASLKKTAAHDDRTSGGMGSRLVHLGLIGSRR